VVQRLIEACKGDERPDFPVLDELSGGNFRQDEHRLEQAPTSKGRKRTGVAAD
jgi:hypothetical protein